MLRCPECNSKDLVKAGFKKYEREWKKPRRVKRQRWLCLDCGLHTIKPKGLGK